MSKKENLTHSESKEMEELFSLYCDNLLVEGGVLYNRVMDFLKEVDSFAVPRITFEEAEKVLEAYEVNPYDYVDATITVSWEEFIVKLAEDTLHADSI